MNIENNFKINSSINTGPPSAINLHNDTLYIADEFNHRILGINQDGELVCEIGSKGTAHGEFHYPKGMTFDSKGNLFVADCWNHRVQRFSPEGRTTACFGSYGSAPGQFNEPLGIAIDKSDRIFVVERCNHRIQVFSSECKSEGFWGGRGTEAEELRAEFYNTPHHKLPPQLFEFPTSIALNSNGDLFIADSGNHRIQKFSNTGDFIKAFGCRGTGEGEFQYPHGITIDENDNLLVSDFNNNRIQVFNSNGKFVSSVDNISSPTSLYSIPEHKLFSGSAFNNEIKIIPVNIQCVDEQDSYSFNAADYSEEAISSIESKLFILKKDLIATSTMLAEKSVFIENSKLNGISAPVELEKEEYNLHKKEEALKEELLTCFCLYKKTVLGNYKASDLIFERPGDNSTCKENTVKIFINRFFNLCNELAKLFTEKEVLEDKAEGLIKSASPDDNESYKGFRKALAEILIIDQFLPNIIAVFNIYTKILNSFIRRSYKDETIKLVFIEAFRLNDSIIKSVSKIFTSFNNDWNLIIWGWETKIDHDLNIIDELKSLFASDFLKEADDLLAAKRYETLPDANSNKDVKAILEEIENIKNNIIKKDGEVTVHCEEIAKYQALNDALITDAIKSSQVRKKLILINFNYILIKKYISNQFNICTVLVFKLCKLFHNSTDGIDKLRNSFSDTINDLNGSYEKLYGEWKKGMHEKTHNENAAGVNQLVRLRPLLQYVTFMLNEYQGLKELLSNAKRSADNERSTPTYDMTFLRFVDKERNITEPAGLAADNEGNLYISDSNNHRVKKVSQNGDFISNFGSFGNLPGKFNDPIGIVVDKNNYVYICDSGNNRIQKFSSEGDFISSFGKLGAGNGEFNFPYRIFIDDEEFIYVNDSGNNRIQKFDSNGNFISVLGVDEKGNSLVEEPTGFYILNKDNIIIAGKSNQTLSLFDNSSGQIKKTTGRKKGTMPGEFQFITDITTDENDNIYVTDLYNCRVQIFNKELEFISLIDTYGYGDACFKFYEIGAVSVYEKYLYVADFGQGAIHRYVI